MHNDCATKPAGGELSLVKREQILRGARAIFRELGYERTCVDAIAVRAGVSKATIYNHFRDKKALFLASFGAETAAVRETFLSLLEMPSGDMEADLRQIGETLLRLTCAPDNVHRYRVLYAEAERFPELGREFYESTLLAGRERMARFFERAAADGLLEVDDPSAAAGDFSALCSATLSRQLELGVIEQVTEELISAQVERAVRTFLRAYGRRS